MHSMRWIGPFGKLQNNGDSRGNFSIAEENLRERNDAEKDTIYFHAQLFDCRINAKKLTLGLTEYEWGLYIYDVAKRLTL